MTKLTLSALALSMVATLACAKDHDTMPHNQAANNNVAVHTSSSAQTNQDATIKNHGNH